MKKKEKEETSVAATTRNKTNIVKKLHQKHKHNTTQKCYTYFNKTVFCSSNYLSGRIHRFPRRSTLHVNGFSNSERFDSICLDCAYQLVDLVISYGK